VIALALRVTPGSVRRWWRAWAGGGAEALKSRGPVSRERQWARVEAELRRGPLAHGFAGDQRWTLVRIKILIGWLLHIGYTPEGVWRLMRRHGWSCQVPVRQAIERDEAAIVVWKVEVCPQINLTLDRFRGSRVARGCGLLVSGLRELNLRTNDGP
jgi:transposase